MKLLKKLGNRIKGLSGSVVRYPLTVAFLIVAAILVAIEINTTNNYYSKYLLALAVGALLSVMSQAIYERFFKRLYARLILMGSSVALTAGYYLILRSTPKISMEIGIRTSVSLFALFIAFIWIPVIQSRISFNESFMVAFKSFFNSIFYSAVLYGGCSAIIATIDQLIYKVDYTAYSHTANIIFVLFAPIFFLSLIPVYPGKAEKYKDPDITGEHDKIIDKSAFCPKFLEVLISYIIIPLTEIFTVILLIYIVMNIRGDFWTNNLLEPMLVTYAITVIMVCILASRIENKFTVFFRMIFPKVLIPIVLFQIAASILRATDTGITSSRYYVILFGIFAACAGVVLSIVPVRKNGIIAAMLIVFCAISVIPPIDAFTISRVSQTNILKTVLTQNGMLKNNVITPNSSISDEDKKKIVLSVEYLNKMEYTDEITWFPSDGYNFYTTFGFYEYDLPENTNFNVNMKSFEPIDIEGYDIMTREYIGGSNVKTSICDIRRSGKSYSLIMEKLGEDYSLFLTDESKQELIRFDTAEIFTRYKSFSADTEISSEDATFSVENDKAKLTCVVQNASINTSSDKRNNYANLYILVKFK